jgi:hypothetical protein
MRLISITEFLKRPAEYMEEFARGKEPVSIVKDGRAYMKVSPCFDERGLRGAAPPTPGPNIVRIIPDDLVPARDLAPPDYLLGRVVSSANQGVATLLYRGKWCGHGDLPYLVLDLRMDGCELFELKLPEETKGEEIAPPIVLARRGDGAGGWFPIYDPRRHPMSLFASGEFSRVAPLYNGAFRSPAGNHLFRVALGFELANEPESPNDTSWFALAVEDPNTGWRSIIFQDETA